MMLEVLNILHIVFLLSYIKISEYFDNLKLFLCVWMIFLKYYLFCKIVLTIFLFSSVGWNEINWYRPTVESCYLVIRIWYFFALKVYFRKLIYLQFYYISMFNFSKFWWEEKIE